MRGTAEKYAGTVSGCTAMFHCGTTFIYNNVHRRNFARSQKLQTMGHVDDTKSFITFSPCDLSKAVSDLNDGLNEISKWCCEYSPLINPKKLGF